MHRIRTTTVLRTAAALAAALGSLSAAQLAQAADLSVPYAFPTSAQEGWTAPAGAGFRTCGAGQPGTCTPGSAAAQALTGVPIPAWSGARLLWTAPSGISGASAHLRFQLRTATSGIVATVAVRQSTASTAPWTQLRRIHQTTLGSVDVDVPGGFRQVSVALIAERSLAAGAVAAAGSDRISLERVDLRLRDVDAPQVAWTQAPPAAWVRGSTCVRGTATDAGFGVHGLRLLGPASPVEAVAPAASLLRPGASRFAEQLCLDTAALPDGLLPLQLEAVDGAGWDGNSARSSTAILRVDNTPPSVLLEAPATTTDTRPELRLRTADAASGVASAVLTLDGVAIPAGRDALGDLVVRPAGALTIAEHALGWRVVDAAGNEAAGTATLRVVDATAPTIAIERVAAGARLVRFHVTDAGSGVAAGSVSAALDGALLPAMPAGDGLWTVRLPTAGGSVARRLVLRASDAAGNAATAAVVIRPAAALASPRSVRLTVRSRSVRAGRRLLLLGRVLPAASVGVHIQALAGGHWVTIPWRVRSGRDGRFRHSVLLRRRGLYVLRAVVRGTASHALAIRVR